METVLKIVTFFLFLKGGMMILDGQYKIPPSKAKNGLKLTVKQKNFNEKMLDEIIEPLVKIFAPFIRLTEETEIKLKYSLARAGMEETPKEYYAKAFVLTAFSLFIPVGILFVGIRGMLPVGILISGVIFYQQLTSYKTELKKKKDAIEMGLPGFIRSILYKLNDSKSGVIKADLISIFEDYLKVANSVFAWDISVLIMEMKAKEIEIALRGFNNRLAIPEVGFLCNALIGITRGEAQSETLAALAREMDIKSKENIKRELDKRPGKVAVACIPLFIISFIAIGYVMLQAMTGGIATLAN